jgi:endonuclease/exonuclease/phosphatase family metal-dependent hydrolase
MKRFHSAAIAVVALLLSSHCAFAAGARSRRLYTPHRVGSVMTYNVYFGADLLPILGATTQAELLAAVGAAWSQVVANDIPKRASSIAHEIASVAPELVGLQEVAQWSLGPSPDNMTVQYDFLQLILDSLSADGARYAAVVVKDDLDAAAPMLDQDSNIVYVRLVDREAILARTDLPAAALKLSNPQAHTYATLLSFTSPVLGEITVPRSWLSVDAKVRGKMFRFITTHLEAYNAQVQTAQAMELISGPADTSLPVVMAGDFNSDANGVGPDLTETYGDLIDAGFQDVWAALYPGVPGDTCCQDGDLSNSTSGLDERIDLVLTRSGMGDSSAQVVGDEMIDTTATPLWASDHASVTARLKVPTQTKFASGGDTARPPF